MNIRARSSGASLQPGSDGRFTDLNWSLLLIPVLNPWSLSVYGFKQTWRRSKQLWISELLRMRKGNGPLTMIHDLLALFLTHKEGIHFCLLEKANDDIFPGMLFPRRFSYCHLLIYTVKGHCQSAHLPCTFSRRAVKYQGWEKDTEIMLLLPSSEKQGFRTGRKYQEWFEGGVKAQCRFYFTGKFSNKKGNIHMYGGIWPLWNPVWDVQLCFPHQLIFRWVGQCSAL